MSILTDLRVGLSAVLAGQAALLDSLTSLGAPAKIVSSAFGLLGVVATVLQLVSESKTVTPVAPVVVPPAPPAPPAA